MTEDFRPLRTIRSFVRRQGRLTSSQQHALDAFSSQWMLVFETPEMQLDFQSVFGNQHPVVMEIGFGDGQCLLTMATAMPETNFLGIEVHRPGVGRLLQGISEKKLNQIRVISADAMDVLTRHISNGSLTGIHLFFPDPWHKKRHHKRRLVQPVFADLIAQKLKPSGYIHLATDWQDYAQHMLAVFNHHPQFINQSASGDFFQQATVRPRTKFETRGLKLGHGVWDLIFKRNDIM